MSQKTIIITVATFFVLGISLFAIGFYLLPKDKVATQEEPTGNIFPFGASGDREIRDKTLPAEEAGAVGDREDFENISRTLKQLSDTPVAGAMSLERGGDIFVRYMERATGHTYEVRVDGRGKKRLSNTTMPAIQQILWGTGGESFIVRYFDENNIIKSIAASLVQKEESQTGIIVGAFLPDNIHDLVVSPDGEKIFYILSFGNTSVGTTASIDGGSKKQIFESPIIEWAPVWLTKNEISLTTKPSHVALGYSYMMQISSGRLNKTLGDITGLTTLVSNDMSKVLYSASGNNTFKTFLYDIKSNTSILFPLATLPEKCAWGVNNVTIYCGAPQVIPKAQYPDMWYQGIVSFNDAIWKINTETGALNILTLPREDVREEIDLTHPILSKNEAFLIFTNKKDSSLWSLELP